MVRAVSDDRQVVSGTHFNGHHLETAAEKSYNLKESAFIFYVSFFIGSFSLEGYNFGG